ncbi:hypothetical protein GOODEAATRI_017968 [Goodea atripinnis]|uniref:Uncharacterized protein n=1 Tax=Goodea atripinnis TaxID=208336 RepID=A0ABV0MT16_9TELE
MVYIKAIRLDQGSATCSWTEGKMALCIIKATDPWTGLTNQNYSGANSLIVVQLCVRVKKLIITDKCMNKTQGEPSKFDLQGRDSPVQNSDFLLTKEEVLAPAFYLQLTFLQVKSGNWFSQFLQRFQLRRVVIPIYGISMSCPESDPLQTTFLNFPQTLCPH